MDKRGDIPITILVIGVFVVCTLALFSFFSSVKLLDHSFTGLDVIEEVNYKIEKNPLQPYYQEEIGYDRSLNFAAGFKTPKIIFSVNYTVP